MGRGCRAGGAGQGRCRGRGVAREVLWCGRRERDAAYSVQCMGIDTLLHNS